MFAFFLHDPACRLSLSTFLRSSFRFSFASSWNCSRIDRRTDFLTTHETILLELLDNA